MTMPLPRLHHKPKKKLEISSANQSQAHAQQSIIEPKSVAETIRSFAFLNAYSDEKTENIQFNATQSDMNTDNDKMAMITSSAAESKSEEMNDFNFESLLGAVNDNSNGEIPVFNVDASDAFLGKIFNKLAADKKKQIIRSRPNFMNDDGMKYFAEFITNGTDVEVVQVNASIVGIINHKSEQLIIWKTTPQPTYHLIIGGQPKESQSRNR